MIYGTTWIKDVKSDKEQSISFAMTNKLDPAQKADGYKLRHAFLKTVMNNRPDFSVPFKLTAHDHRALSLRFMEVHHLINESGR